MESGYFSRFEAVIFDLDGTLVHSEHVWDAAKTEVLAQYGQSVTVAQLRAYLGRGLSDFLDEVFGKPLSGETKREIANKIGAAADNLLPKMRRPVDGAADFLRDLHSIGLLIAICSSSPRRHIESAVKDLQIQDQVDVITSGADLPRGKPDPLPYLRTLEHLGISAAMACAIEDSPSGVASAMGAGLTVLAVGPGCSGPEFQRCALQSESFLDLNGVIAEFIEDA